MKPKSLAALFVILAILFSGSFLFEKIVYGGNGFTSLMAVGNSPPAISSVAINNNQASIILIPNSTTSINVTAQISDNDGCQDLTAGNPTILLYRSGIGSSTCLSGGDDPLNCYSATDFTASSTCAGTSINTTTTFPVQYYAQATDASSAFPGQNWMATVIFTDPSSSQASADSTSVSSTNDMATMVAISVSSSTVNYGTLFASSTTSSTNQTVGFINAGNASTTIKVNGTALTSGGNSIATSSQHYATTSFTFGTGDIALSETATTISGINIAPGPASTSTSSGGLSSNWISTTNLTTNLSEGVGAAYNGYLYTIGGNVSGPAISTVSFAPINATGSIGAWANTQSLPFIDDLEAGAAYNGFLYAVGGNADNGVTSTVVFAPINATGSIGAWTKTTALPYVVDSEVAVASNGFLYVFGGAALVSFVTTSTVLFAPINATGSIGAWTKTTAMPYPIFLNDAVINNGFVYVVGGVESSSALNGTSTVIFAPVNATGSIGAWTKTTALPNEAYRHHVAAYGGYLYEFGGHVVDGGTSASETSTVLFARINGDGSVGAWASTFAMPNGLASFQSAFYNGYLYAVAGDEPAHGATSTVRFAPFAPPGSGIVATTTYWGVSIPGGTSRGTYNAVTTFTAVYSP